MNLAKQVKQRLAQLPAGGVITSRALHKLSPDSQQVDKAASRLYKTLGLKKLRNGLFYKPYNSNYFGELPPAEKNIIHAVKEQYGALLNPTGELAAYELGLTPTLPDSVIYECDKRLSPINLSNHKLYFRKINGKKLRTVEASLLTILKAMEYLYSENETLKPLQQQHLQRLLNRYPNTQISKAITLWPRWFQAKAKALIHTINPPYITGLSALNIPYQNKQADWHQQGLLNSQQFKIAGKNYSSAPGLTKTELFDCSNFLSRHNITLATNLCATPLRAIKDMLYTSIVKKNQYPGFLMLNQLMLDLPTSTIKAAVDNLLLHSNEQQKQLLITWAENNELN